MYIYKQECYVFLGTYKYVNLSLVILCPFSQTNILHSTGPYVLLQQHMHDRNEHSRKV